MSAHDLISSALSIMRMNLSITKSPSWDHVRETIKLMDEYLTKQSEPKKEKPMANFIKVNASAKYQFFISVRSIIMVGQRRDSTGSWIQYGVDEDNVVQVSESVEELLALIDSTVEKFGGGA